MSLKDSWDSIVNAVKPIRILKPEEQSSDPEADLANTLSIWVLDSACSDYFLPWLEERIEVLDLEEEASIRSHPDLLMTKGRRMEAKAIRDAFLQWRGQGRQAPAQEK